MAANTETSPLNDCASDEEQALRDVEWQPIADRLVNANLWLTALELHTELIENGIELPRLRDFFSNPGNFERQSFPKEPANISPSQSITTLDSVELTRYSDDGGKYPEDQVAVLEFELRKAQDTIKALRGSLTMATEGQTEGNMKEKKQVITKDDIPSVDEPILPHEKRALNYLVNEYLLKQNYRLTSITFTDENDDQDFEDWDDVGLNVPKPPGLLAMFRGSAMPVMPNEEFEREKQMLRDEINALDTTRTSLNEQLQSINNVNENLQIKNEEMEQVIVQLKNELDEARRQPSPPIQEIQEEHILNNNITESQEEEFTSRNEPEENESEKTTHNDIEFDQPEVVTDDRSIAVEQLNAEIEHTENQDATTEKVELSTDQEEVSQLGEDNSRIFDPKNVISKLLDSNPEKMSTAFLTLLRSMVLNIKEEEDRLTSEICNIEDTVESAVGLLTRCLPFIVPNVLLNKRDELLPMILFATIQQTDKNERDKLLHMLFNLIKRPEQLQRKVIIEGCVAYAKHAGPGRTEEELLPQCWLQIDHKFHERRLLVIEACGALASHLSEEITSSLILSMLKQMYFENKSPEIKEAIVKTYGLLMAYVVNEDKYEQSFDVLMAAIQDTSESVINAALEIFLPSLAMWAYQLNLLEVHMIGTLIKTVENMILTAPLPDQLDEQNSATSRFENRLDHVIKALINLTPAMYAMVLKSASFASEVDLDDRDSYGNIYISSSKRKFILHRLRFFIIEIDQSINARLTDLDVIIGSKKLTKSLHDKFNELMQKNDDEEVEIWNALKWVMDDYLPRLMATLGSLDVSLWKAVNSLSKLLNVFCRTFGRGFTETRVKANFKVMLSPGAVVSDGRCSLATSVMAAYAIGILTAFTEISDREELAAFLKETIFYLGENNISLESVKTTFINLGKDHDLHEFLINILWDAVVHTSPVVRSYSAILLKIIAGYSTEEILSKQIVPALITLGTDQHSQVRLATVSAFGSIAERVSKNEILERIGAQFQSFLEDNSVNFYYDIVREIVQCFSRIGPNADPSFRDEFILVKLVKIASNNNQNENSAKRKQLALDLLDAYSALTSVYSDNVLESYVLPGLRCLLVDIQAVYPENQNVIEAMIDDCEAKLSTSNINQETVAAAAVKEDSQNNFLQKIKEKRFTGKNVAQMFSRRQ
ncbi:LisH domain and HEAT repeat-containing protein KIAA1468 [Trichoplax sp. H2]|nr:LisH domain and HEAT repeat-containing protein KIAA1468 [Trichoplax sp. H2]|eukprot:RDD47230.1 LisH domain and HEAT repeat-containing protein KIAA1468 [Trichoplax sp. H2]